MYVSKSDNKSPGQETVHVENKALTKDNLAQGSPFNDPKYFYQRGITNMITVDPIDGSSFSGGSVIKFKLPTEGLMLKNSFAFCMPNTLTIDANEARWVQGTLASCLSKIKIRSGKLTIQETNHYGLYHTKQIKYAVDNQSLLCKQNVLGYYPAASNVDGVELQTMILPEEHSILRQTIPLFLLSPANAIHIELTLNSTTLDYTTTNTGSNPRTLTINDPFVIYQELQDEEVMLQIASDPQGYGVHYADVFGETVAVPSGANSATVRYQVKSGRFYGSEIYPIHDADLASQTEHGKLWNENKNDLTKVQVFFNNKSAVTDREITNNAVLYVLARQYFGDKDEHWDNSAVDWAEVDGDFVVALPVTALGRGAFSGLYQNEEFKVTLTYDTASEALTLFCFHKEFYTGHIRDGRLIPHNQFIMS